MRILLHACIALCCLTGQLSMVCAGENTPWGTASAVDTEYPPQKVLYDLTSGDKDEVSRVLDRVGYLYRLYGSDNLDSSIVVVIHGDAVPFFATGNFADYQDLMTRARSLTVGTSIEFRMCRVAARLQEYGPEDIHGFVTMVPMADAEIARLQQDSYAYLY